MAKPARRQIARDGSEVEGLGRMGAETVDAAITVERGDLLPVLLVQGGDAVYFSGAHGGKQHFEAGGEFMDWTLSDS